MIKIPTRRKESMGVSWDPAWTDAFNPWMFQIQIKDERLRDCIRMIKISTKRNGSMGVVVGFLRH